MRQLAPKQVLCHPASPKVAITTEIKFCDKFCFDVVEKLDLSYIL